MVSSLILNTEEVNYAETNILDQLDTEHESALYRLELVDDKEYVVALGSMRTEHKEKGVVYFPLYLVKYKKGGVKNGNGFSIEAKIGVFEVETERALSIQDEDQDIDLEQLDEPLLFSFVTPEYLDKHGLLASDLDAQQEQDETKTPDEETNMAKDIEKEEEEETSENTTPDLEVIDLNDEDEEDEMFSVLPSIEKSIAATSSILNEDDTSMKGSVHYSQDNEPITLEQVFQKEDPLPVNPSWPSETDKEAKKMRIYYRNNKTIQDNWVVQYMNNKEYKIHPVESNGDCFFAAVRDAYAQIGHKTSVALLRKYLSQEVSLELYENYKSIYDGIAHEVQTAEEEAHRLESVNQELKKQSQSTRSANQQKEILNEAVKVKQDYSTQKMYQGGANELLEEFGWMKSIQSVDDLKQFVQTSEYWADTWAISTLELLLSVKFIILENTEDVDSVMRCTQSHEEMSRYSEYTPKYYMLLAHSNQNHYELISYKEKKLFTFAEVPYDMKVKVVRGCIENNDQSYYAKIPDFRQFRYELNIPEYQAPTASALDDEKNSDMYLYDPSIVLTYHKSSDGKKKAGQYGRDEIPMKRRNEFSVLNNMENWRRKLDDQCCDSPFTMNQTDKKRWNSVAHYLAALPFKESNPAIYEEFSDDSKSALSKDITQALMSLEKRKGKVGKHYQAAKECTPIPPDELDVHRKDALREKFRKDTPLGRLLKATNAVQLNQFRRNQSPYVDVPLMEVRYELSH